MTQAQFRFVLAIACSCFAKVTFAAGLTSFIGLGLGNTTAEVSGTSGQTTTSGAGYSLVAGSQINPIFAIEAEYINLGSFSDSTSNVAATGLGMSGVLTLPLMGMFSAYGKVGMARIETTVSPLAGSSSTTVSSDAVVGLSYGYGLQIDMVPNASLRLSWDIYKSSTLADTFTDRINMNSSALLIYRF